VLRSGGVHAYRCGQGPPRGRGIEVASNADGQRRSCLDTPPPRSPVEGVIRLKRLVDRSFIEIFGNDGPDLHAYEYDSAGQQ
jgi:hypothetical protein